MWKRAVAVLVIGLFALGFFGGVTQADKAMPPVVKKTQNPTTKYTIHAPIQINNDTDFDTQFPGRVISGFDITGSIIILNCAKPFTVKDCYLHNMQMGIDLGNCSNGIIQGNNCSGYYDPMSNSGGIYLSQSDNNFIMYNICSGSSGIESSCEGISLWSSDNNTLTGNAISEGGMMGGTGIVLGSSIDNTLASNSCNGRSSIGISLGRSPSNILINNSCNANGGGIYLSYSDINLLTNNKCSGNQRGIDLYHSNNGTFTMNNCSVNSYCGFAQYYSENNTLKNNICCGNINGIVLDNSSKNLFSNNDIYSNSNNGTLLHFSNSNTFVYNNVTNNKKYGIYIDSSSFFNRIHHNSFIGNHGANATRNSTHVQVADVSGNNDWNSFYPSGGNYWSDWTGPDAMKGPYQNISGPDGIVDYPYLIDGGKGANDSYPLTTPPPPFPWVTLISPFSGEAWYVNTMQNITWLASSGNGTLTINIEYSSTGSSGPWISIASGSPNNGNFLWMVPNITSTNCYIRVTVIDSSSPAQTAYDMNINPFTIQTPPPVPEAPLPMPLVILCIILVTIIVINIRKR